MVKKSYRKEREKSDERKSEKGSKEVLYRVSVCVCVCVCGRERESNKARMKGNEKE